MTGQGSETAGATLSAPASADRRRILIGCCIGGLLNITTVIIYSFGVFAVGIADELGIAPIEATRLIGPTLLIAIFTPPVVGWAIDRWPRRNVALAAMAMLAAAACCIALAPASRAGITGGLAAAVVLASLATPAIYSAYLSETFAHRRGLALGIATAFTGIGIAVIPAVAARLIEILGWRATYAVLAGIIVTAAIGNALLFPRARARARCEQQKGADAIGTALRDARFWILVVLFFLIPITANSIPIYLPALLAQRGADPAVAAASLSALGLTMIVSRPTLGFLLDRWPTWIVMAILIAGPMAGSAAVLALDGLPAAFAGGVGYGIGMGGEFVALGFLVARTFGTQHFGVVYGWLSVAVACGVAGGPILVGWLSSQGSFTPALILVLAAGTAALVFSVVLDRFSRTLPAAVT